MSDTLCDQKKAQVKSAFNVLVAVTETIREAGQINEGILYTALMTHGCDMEAFRKIVAIVVGSGLVAKSGVMLTWKGPVVH